jgi:hypothetical protein
MQAKRTWLLATDRGSKQSGCEQSSSELHDTQVGEEEFNK